MYLISYIIFIWLRSVLFGQSFKKSPVMECLRAYQEVKSENKKNYWQVFCEVNQLCRYWHTFPDTYFVFCHFLKGYSDKNLLYTFLPQGAYSRTCRGGAENTDYKILINDKVLFHEYASMMNIPVPEMLVVYKNNHWFIHNTEVEDNDVDMFLDNYEEDRIFVKLSSEGASRGVFPINRKGGFWEFNGTKINAIELRKKYGKKGFFLERQLGQESVLKSYNPDTVNTIRILTLNDGEYIKIVSAAVRFGRKGAFVDNMHAGGMAVSVDVSTGKMGLYAGRRFDATKYYEHPDSHLKFDGKDVPQWKEIVALVHQTLTVFPQYRSVGFDIVTTENGPVVLEINTGSGMDLAQVGKKRGIANEFEKYMKLARIRNK